MTVSENANHNKYTRLDEVGEFTATLMFTQWSKQLSLGCYFETDDGRHFYLYAWRKESGERKGQYCPKDEGVNFREVENGTRWLITTKRNSRGNTYWSTAEEL